MGSLAGSASFVYRGDGTSVDVGFRNEDGSIQRLADSDVCGFMCGGLNHLCIVFSLGCELLGVVCPVADFVISCADMVYIKGTT